MLGAYVRNPNKRHSQRKPLKQVGLIYRLRYDNLVALGFSSYPDYLDSRLWLSIRARVLARDLGRCICCDRPAVSVHHITYNLSVLRGEQDDQLVSVCLGCHKTIEFWHGKKLSSGPIILKKLIRRILIKRGHIPYRFAKKNLLARCST